MTVQQAIGTPRDRGKGAEAFLDDFVADSIRSGFVADVIAKHGVAGELSVSPAGDHRLR